MRKERSAFSVAAIVDILLWITPTISFLIYTIFFDLIPTSAVAPHLKIIFSLLIAVAGTEWIILFIFRETLFSLLISSIIKAIAFISLFFFYFASLTGLSYWNRLPSFDLLRPYFFEPKILLETIGISLLDITVGGAFLFIGIFYLVFWWTFRHNISLNIYLRTTPTIRLGIIILSISSIAAVSAELQSGKWASVGEPFSVALHPERWHLQGNPISESRARFYDERATIERAQYSPANVATSTNVILIVADALRLGHMGIYGYERETTPFLTHLRTSEKLSLTRKMHASCAESTCGLLSILSASPPHKFSRRPITLHEILQWNGYTSLMILSGDHTNFYGLRKIYGEVDSYIDGTTRNDFGVNDDRNVIDRVEELPEWNGSPNIIQFHLMSSHPLGKRWLIPTFTPERNYALWSTQNENKINSDLSSAINYYDNGVIQTDHIIERILNSLEEKEYLEDALVIITSDHGESLGENGIYGHAQGVSEQVLRIPFIMATFGEASDYNIEIKNRIHSQPDIAPTILNALDLPLPQTWSGAPMQETNRRCYTFFRQGEIYGVYSQNDSNRSNKYWINTEDGTENLYEINFNTPRNSPRTQENEGHTMRSMRRAILKVTRRETEEAFTTSNEGSDDLHCP